ncbi:MAG: tRNA (uridine(34)/cytosine(34)/5-carboxymethylaminomethyluridine(34)-2'-O)-methyltransferase TrmL [Clostridiales bacterium]|nr:tRNA (uridine(34)/cytosine(34)/5-carboxymethylaminomethyluridine(34)-2'-O)-methyltransferase TrmL [Clostridiales bacterium]
MIHIVLVEPEIPQNTGNIARTCAATGAVLHLVKPLGFSIDDKKLKRAGLDYWHQLQIEYHDSLQAFLSKYQDKALYFFTTKATHTYADPVYPEEVFLVFGKETKGLPEELLYEHPEQCVRIPMLDQRRSLNLSNSVAIGVYEVLRQQAFCNMKNTGELTRYKWPEPSK